MNSSQSYDAERRIFGSVESVGSAGVFGQVMGLVAVTVGFFTLGAYLGRDFSAGAGATALFIAGLGSLGDRSPDRSCAAGHDSDRILRPVTGRPHLCPFWLRVDRRAGTVELQWVTAQQHLDQAIRAWPAASLYKAVVGRLLSGLLGEPAHK